MSEALNYFGYGANRDPKMMSFITGRPETELVGRLAILQGFSLAVQRLDQVPNTLSRPSVLKVPPREILRASWGESYLSYAIYENPGGQTSGTIWEIDQADRERVKDWELTGDWYKDDVGVAVTPEGERIDVITESLGDGQHYDHGVDGLHYDTWLQPIEHFEAIAAKARREYDERLLGLSTDN